MSHPFELNPLQKDLHVVSLTGIADNMLKLLEDFKTKNPDKTEVYEEKKKTIEQIAEAGLYILAIYQRCDQLERKRTMLKLENMKLSLAVERLKMELQQSEQKYKGLIEFDKK